MTRKVHRLRHGMPLRSAMSLCGLLRDWNPVSPPTTCGNCRRVLKARGWSSYPNDAALWLAA